MIEQIKKKAFKELSLVKDKESLNKIRIKYLSKKNGELTKIKTKLINNNLKFNNIINVLKKNLQEVINLKLLYLEKQELNKKIIKEDIDVTLDGIGQNQGTLHPITKTLNRIKSFFTKNGFLIELGPEIETNYYNFESLNIPFYHPARNIHDTFYINKNYILRTHTSGIQIRIMEKQKLPIKIISPGKVYRCDSDITHTPMFHQVEGLIINNNVSFSELKGLIHLFLNSFFENNLKIRFRPSYFPFTEPSAETDIKCILCNNKGCKICKYSTWIEVLGCGMVHPKILKSCNIDPEQYNGFAFGMGVERLSMLKYGINDLRLFFENDLRFLKQF